MNLIIGFSLALALIASIPIKPGLFWLFFKAKQIQKQVDSQEQPIYFSKYSLVFMAVIFVEFIKGFGLPYLSGFFFFETPPEDMMLILTFVMVLCCHHWSLFRKFKLFTGGTMMLWGLYTFIALEFLWITPLLFIGVSLLFNSFVLGRLISICLMFPVLWFFEFEPIFMIINFIIFLFSFIAFSGDLFNHLERRTHTLLKSFERR